MAAEKSTIVIKVGPSSLLTPNPTGVDHVSLANISRLIETICTIKREHGWNVVLVTCGDVGFGEQRLHLEHTPKQELPTLQALAATGQMRLMRMYDDLFSHFDQICAQILLTNENLDSRSQYVNAKNTLKELLNMGIVPIVNENDTVAVQNFGYGDNDTLSAIFAGLVDASYLVLLTDVDALYSSNPKTDPDAKPIRVVEDISALEANIEGKGSSFGTGFMANKIKAAKLANAYGIHTVLCNGKNPERILSIITGKEDVGTTFIPHSKAVRGRKRWILALVPMGEITVNKGAEKSILKRSSLFSDGIIGVTGTFGIRDGAVRIMSHDGRELARGLSNYSSDDVTKILGMNSSEISEILGYVGAEWVISRENYALINPPKECETTADVENLAPADPPSLKTV